MKKLLISFLILFTACQKELSIQNQTPTYVSVKDFGAKGDGITK